MMAKTPAHAEAATARQRETLATIYPGKIGKQNERVLALTAHTDFAEAVARYNAATVVKKSFDDKADAEEFAALLRGNTNVRFANVSRAGQRWNTNAELFEGPSTDELAGMATAGDPQAFWALYARLLPKIERNSVQFGDFGAAFDQDDAHQRQVEILWEMIQADDMENVERSFVGRFFGQAHRVSREAQAATKAYSIPVDSQDAGLVQTVIRQHGGDLAAAADDLANNPERKRRMSLEKFYALLSVLDESRYVELDPATAEGPADPTAADALSSVESGFENETLSDVWETLTERERSILSLRYGMDGQEPMAPEEIGKTLSLTKRRVNQILKGIHDRIAAGNLSAAREYAPSTIQAPAPVRKPRPAPVEDPAPGFPVHTRRITDAPPAQTVAERRSNPQDGIRSPLWIRAVERAYAVPERVYFGVAPSNLRVTVAVSPDGLIRLRDNRPIPAGAEDRARSLAEQDGQDWSHLSMRDAHRREAAAEIRGV